MNGLTTGFELTDFDIVFTVTQCENEIATSCSCPEEPEQCDDTFNYLYNGGFESPNVPTSTYQHLTDIPGWDRLDNKAVIEI